MSKNAQYEEAQVCEDLERQKRGDVLHSADPPALRMIADHLEAEGFTAVVGQFRVLADVIDNLLGAEHAP